MNKLVAFLLIVIVSPLMVIVSALVFFSLGKPILFRQKRLKSSGQNFIILKFRTMSGGGMDLLSEDDYFERTTPITRFLRATKLDELPQLFNIILGDMVFFGPRALPEKSLSLDVPKKYISLRNSVLPGIIGIGQIFGLDHRNPRRRLAADIYFIKNNNACMRANLVFRLIKFLVNRTEKVQNK